jgi:hypothetical protein
VVRRSLSNRQMLKVCSSVLQSYPKSGKIRSKVALSIRAPLENTRHWKCFGRDGAGGSADRRARPAVRQTMSRPEPEGAALLIAETVAALTQLVRRHKAKRARACVHAFHRWHLPCVNRTISWNFANALNRGRGNIDISGGQGSLTDQPCTGASKCQEPLKSP